MRNIRSQSDAEKQVPAFVTSTVGYITVIHQLIQNAAAGVLTGY